ncbi:ABC transporter ATP-binding protein [Streptomyces sp. AV19]|uniref:ABC transporter ATP-binding protein n=1 Tax=Streptomyces sp. AV19 TaxID=2793068 RepID=UPI0018FEA97E|nr:ABC transporter ATP-binding protein [Streptomyces sp. AV19]MBH1935643.1 ABC transporter ATP-binding protein [Streptomyces sp. AV19]MDG4536081.1 ABC transporter ATP-binding protein [Streptomyces sp. AV19]
MTITTTTFTGDGRRTGAAPVVSFANVSKTFGTVRAVADLDLHLYPGETVALLGPNGAGKSSTLDLLLGLSRPDAGVVELFGTSPQQAVVQGKVGAMLQSGGLMEDVRVRELVRLACDLHPRAYSVEQVMEQAGITEIADRVVNKLSGGQEQRVRFALATAGENELIVLDEPTTGMDVTSRQTFWATMRRQADAGRAVLFATHYLEEADAIADRVVVLHRGRVLADGSAAEIKARAGARRIVFDLDGEVPTAALRGLPYLASVEVSGRTVRMQSRDADATVHALYGLGLYPRNLEVAGLGLEQAFIAITDAATAEESVIRC